MPKLVRRASNVSRNSSPTRTKTRRPKRSRSLIRLKPSHWIALFVTALCAIFSGWLVTQAGIDWHSPQQWIQYLHGLGWIGILVFISFSAIAIVVSPIPSTPFTIAAGTIWGPIQAGIYGTIGIYLGSIIAYWIGRTWGRATVKVLTGKAIYLSKHRGEKYLGWVVMITHMIPVIPYDLISYGAGISGLSFIWFALPCLLGIMPCTFLLTHLGAAIMLNSSATLAIALVFIAVLGVLAWGVKRRNWFGLADVISFQ